MHYGFWTVLSCQRQCGRQDLNQNLRTDLLLSVSIRVSLLKYSSYFFEFEPFIFFFLEKYRTLKFDTFFNNFFFQTGLNVKLQLGGRPWTGAVAYILLLSFFLSWDSNR